MSTSGAVEYLLLPRYTAINDVQTPDLHKLPSDRKRRVPLRNTSRKRRARALDVNRRDFLHEVQNQASACAQQAIADQTLMIALAFIRSDISTRYAGNERLQDMLNVLDNYIRAFMSDMIVQLSNWQLLALLDAELGDLPVADEISRPYHKRPAYRRVRNFVNDDEARNYTAFTKAELYRLLRLFNLPRQINVNMRPDGRTDVFHREELLIFTLMKMRTGSTNALLIDSIVGGRSETRWGYGYKWMVQYLDDRYSNVIGMNGVQRWVPHFPRFAEHIRTNIARDRIHIDPVTFQQVGFDHGVHFAPNTFRVTGFIDCTDYQIARPHSGPAGDYFGSMRKPNWYHVQRAFYQGHIKAHGVRVVSLCLPNGLTAGVWGPVSSRRNDLDILNMSGLGAFLQQIQQGTFPQPYAFYGDGIYSAANSPTIISSHVAAANAPLTPQQQNENRMMKKARISIEWSFGLVKNRFSLADESEHHFKLENDPDHVLAQVRVMHLLSNCSVCLHGCNISSRQTFNCPPPALEAYLS